ncbi:hypothetical protein APY94_08315 [Thermococcus celericrescens]|uniref:Uncharacterized protein n=1 Tax=Thermococcus celericrescens TaxID=227598 RepID=A0A117IT22_9EURY|nr:hypothetical protein [Thermococcus celericrescens]KUH32780.1 hypothetical protein APY94_08315 [Thermococcus celericrescens]
MLLRADGTTATLYIDYTIEGMINGANKIVGKGVAKMDISVSVYQGTVYADVNQVYKVDYLVLSMGFFFGFAVFVMIHYASRMTKVLENELGGS